MPANIDREALLFVEASAASTHYQTLPVLVRWRRIALDPRLPQAAGLVASRVGEAMRLWNDPRAQGLGQVLIADIVRKSPHPEARRRAAYGIGALRERFTGERTLKLPEPALALLALGEAAASGEEDRWTRLYSYAFSAAEALDHPPIRVDRLLDPNSNEVPERLAAFTAWFRKERRRLERKAAEQIREIAAAAAAVREDD